MNLEQIQALLVELKEANIKKGWERHAAAAPTAAIAMPEVVVAPEPAVHEEPAKPAAARKPRAPKKTAPSEEAPTKAPTRKKKKPG